MAENGEQRKNQRNGEQVKNREKENLNKREDTKSNHINNPIQSVCLHCQLEDKDCLQIGKQNAQLHVVIRNSINRIYRLNREVEWRMIKHDITQLKYYENDYINIQADKQEYY